MVRRAFVRRGRLFNIAAARMLGSVIYTDYVYPFELAAVLLLVAIVAAAVLTLRRRRNVKYNDPAEQMRAEPSRRVRLVDIPSATNDNQNEKPQ